MWKNLKLLKIFIKLLIMIAFFIILCLIGPLLGYFFGSIMFAILFSKKFKKKDIRQLGSHNPGFTNTLRTFGSKFGALILILDMVKVVIPTIIIFLIIKFSTITQNYINDLNLANFNFIFLLYLTPAFAILGHIFPIFFKFKGGKGVASYFGFLFTISPFIFIISCLLLIAIVFIKKIMSLGSIVSVFISSFLFLIPGINYFYLVEPNFISCINYTINISTFIWLLPIFTLMLLISSLIIFKHKTNIINLINKKEKKLSILG